MCRLQIFIIGLREHRRTNILFVKVSAALRELELAVPLQLVTSLEDLLARPLKSVPALYLNGRIFYRLEDEEVGQIVQLIKVIPPPDDRQVSDHLISPILNRTNHSDHEPDDTNFQTDDTPADHGRP